MSFSHQPRTLDRFTQIGDLARSVQHLLRHWLWLLGVGLVIETAYLGISHAPGAMAFGLISAGTLVLLFAWRGTGIGLPVLPVLGLQHLIAYGLPIAIGHEVTTLYPKAFLSEAGAEVLIFCCSLAGAWLFGMKTFLPGPARSYALRGFNRHGSEKLRRLGFTLIVAATAYHALQGTRWLEPVFAVLPPGSFSLATALSGAAGACGFFLVAMFVGANALSPPGRFFFWLLLALDCLISASGYLLSPATATVASVLIGLFWSSGRVPWRYLAIVGLALAFLNVGKYAMRDRYWNLGGDDEMPSLTLSQMPASYVEWFQASSDILTGDGNRNPIRAGEKETNQGVSLLERINNLQNLLFVIDAMETWSIAPLGGKTYSLIPPLLLPRILWPGKPRAHEGQAILNVHFGRQDLNSTYKTYIAWGLLPEAYGNFGPKAGAAFLGVLLGICFAWLENFTARKLLLSLEGFVAFVTLLVMASSFEMVASVLVTTLFQSVATLVIVSAFFVERTLGTPRPPSP